jgi:Zn-dependent metalloprotease
MSLSSKTLSLAVLMALAGSATAASPAAEQAKVRALTNVHANLAAVRGNSEDRFNVAYAVVDANGDEHVRMKRTYAGLDVIGGDFVVHSRGAALRSVSQTLGTSARPSLRPSIDSDDAITFAGADFGTGFQGVPSARLVVFALNTKPTLAYEVVFAGQKRNGDPTEMHYFIDAANGRVLNKWDMVHTGKPSSGGGSGGTPAVGNGNTRQYGDVVLNTALSGGTYNLTDTTRGGGATYEANNVAYSMAARRAVLFTDANNDWGNHLASDRATSATDAHFGVAKTWDFYQSTFNRLGIFNDGQGVKSYVHVGNGWVNAAWYANAMYYGDGGGSYLPLTALDIAGHEMSHGVTQATNGLVYSNQDSGGLNEASSDIMGTLVEFYANNSNDAPDYLIGEKIYAVEGPTKALRYMFKPSAVANDDSVDCYPSGGFTNTDPHYSSGVANHFFYLLAAGPVNPAGFSFSAADLVCNGDTGVTGIGNDKAGQIWYRAMDIYFLSGTNYPQARAATISAATDLYGAASAEVAAVKRAWSAVGFN